MWWCSFAASGVYYCKHRFQCCTASSPQNLFSCCIFSRFHIFRYAAVSPSMATLKLVLVKSLHIHCLDWLLSNTQSKLPIFKKELKEQGYIWETDWNHKCVCDFHHFSMTRLKFSIYKYMLMWSYEHTQLIQCGLVVAVPISIYVFTMPLPYLGVASSLPTGFMAGAIILILGLLIYAWTPSNGSSDASFSAST